VRSWKIFNAFLTDDILEIKGREGDNSHKSSGVWKGEKVLIRRLENNDIPLIKEMPTGIEEDYVLRIIDSLVEEENMIGFFYNEKLVGIAGMTLFEEKYAVLGRLRTHTEYRKQGIASVLMKTLQHEALKKRTVSWVGYTTEGYNKGGNCLSPHLQMQLEATLVSSRISPYTVLGENITGPFKSIDAEKKLIINRFWKTTEQSFFPYSIYYPLPDLPSLSPAYLEKVELFVNDREGFMMVKEDKGASYLHVIVLNKTTLYSKAMWDIINDYASEEARTIWIDLPREQAKWLAPYSHQTIWHLYGQKKEFVK
jgi:GNAT superfamily N-acetyltransferase